MKFIFYSPAVGAPWDYTSLESGVGGSETFHIEMATRLARRGHEVISYNDLLRPAEERVHGVLWRTNKYVNYCHDGIYVVQRRPLFLEENDVPGASIWPGLWSPAPSPQKFWHVYHDVGYPPHDTPERMARYDRIIALSAFHAEYLRNMGHQNVTASRGGIAVDRMNALALDLAYPGIAADLIQRNPARLIYASAPERGLLPLLHMFARAKQHVPALELHVYYGWEGYDRQLAQDFTGRWAREKAEMVRLLAQPGITWHGRVTQTALWTAYLQSGIWVYPTEYPEICCVTAMEAQALGAIPIYTPTWALQDHVFAGIRLDGACSEDRLARARFEMEIVRLATAPHVQEAVRPRMIAQACARFDWENVCDQFEEMAAEDLGDAATQDDPPNFIEFGHGHEITAPAPAPFLPPGPVLWPNDMRFGDNHPKDVFARREDGSVFGGWFGDENKRHLARLIAKYNVKTVCEIGCFLGYSTAWFARRVEKVCCVDKWIAYAEDPGDAELLRILERLHIPLDFYDVWRRNMEAEGLFHKITPVRGYSVAVAHLVPDVDLVYVDGDHTDAGCLADILAYGPKARFVMCGDDFGPQHPGIKRALDKIAAAAGGDVYRHDGPFWWIESPTAMERAA